MNLLKAELRLWQTILPPLQRINYVDTNGIK